MRFLPLIVAFLAGCASAPASLAEPAQEPASPPTEYPVPLIFSDGHVEQIIVEDSKPEEGVRMIFCKDMPAQILCLTSVKGVAQWMSVPKAADRNKSA